MRFYAILCEMMRSHRISHRIKNFSDPSHRIAYRIQKKSVCAHLWQCRSYNYIPYFEIRPEGGKEIKLIGSFHDEIVFTKFKFTFRVLK